MKLRKGCAAVLAIVLSVCTAALLVMREADLQEGVQTAVLHTGELVQSVLLTGTVQYEKICPCAALKNGIISKVYATPGTRVQKGDPLFSFDTQAEEQALAALYEMEYQKQRSLDALGETASVLALQNELERASSEKQLLASIEASVIRAPIDGVVDHVYVQSGDYIAATSVLGTVHGEKKQIAASIAGLDGIDAGKAAIAQNGDKTIYLVVAQVTAPDENTGNQMIYFETLNQDELDRIPQGQMIEIRLTKNVSPVSALVPFSAIDAEGAVWLVRNGRAYRQKLSLEYCSKTHAAAPMELEGETVILYPEMREWKDGMRVQ